MKKKLENQIQNEIFEYLTSLGLFFWRSNNIPVFGRNNAGKYQYRSLPKYTPRGLPDIIIIHDGRFIALEVKREGCKLRPEQGEFGANIVKNGGNYHTVYSVDDVKTVLTHLGI